MKNRPVALELYFQHLKTTPGVQVLGEVVEANGNYVQSIGPPCSLGDCCEIQTFEGKCYRAEVIGFRGNYVVSMPLSSTTRIRYGDKVRGLHQPAQMTAGPDMLGRVLDANGSPLDGLPAVRGKASVPLQREAPAPLGRKRITTPLSVGVRAIDSMLTVARGQRIGIFGGSGVGKSTLLGMMTRNTSADLTVVGLVGERGREVSEFLEDSLGDEGRKRSVLHVSTSDESPLMRLRCAQAATATAEYFASRGLHVLLILDSLTRFAMAAREIGLAAGEPPSTKGYPPSVVVKLARLLERAGNFSTGSITGFYTVLMEGDDEQDPIVDSARSILDGHIVLSREMAGAGMYPPIDLLRSLSRLMPSVTTEDHQERSRHIRHVLSTYARGEDLIRVGAYKHGSDPELDRALQMRPALLELFRQGAREPSTLQSAVTAMNAMVFQG